MRYCLFIRKKKKLRHEVEAFGAAGRIRTAHITPRNRGFAGAPDLGFDVLRTDEVGVSLLPPAVYKKIPKAKAFGIFGAAGRIRTADLILTKDALYLLSYSSILATEKGLEPSTSSVTGWRSNQLNYSAIFKLIRSHRSELY